MNSLIELSSVALVKIDAGAEFSSLQTASEAIRLYIDLNQGQVGDEDNLNILGFQLRNIFFITNTQRIRMQEVSKLEFVKKGKLCFCFNIEGNKYVLSS